MSEPAKFVIFGLIIVLLAVLALWFPSLSDPRMSIIKSEQSERAGLGQYPCFS
jgi:hypothetical protein